MTIITPNFFIIMILIWFYWLPLLLVIDQSLVLLLIIGHDFYNLSVVNEATSARVGLHHIRKHRMEILCPALLQIRNGIVSCHHNGSRIPCHENVPVGTVAYFECDEYYVPKPTQIIECLINGTWAAPLSSCVPGNELRCLLYPAWQTTC